MTHDECFSEIVRLLGEHCYSSVRQLIASADNGYGQEVFDVPFESNMQFLGLAKQFSGSTYWVATKSDEKLLFGVRFVNNEYEVITP